MSQTPENPPHHDGEIRRRLFQNSGIMMGCRLVTAATALIAVPFITGVMGVDGFGTWESMMAITSLCQMIPSSVTQTLLWKMSEAHGTSDYDGMRRWMRVGVVGIFLFAAMILPIAYHFRFGLVIGFQVPDRFRMQAYWVLPCAVGITMLNALNDVMSVTISACQRTGLVTIVQAIALILNYTTAIVLIRLGFALEGLLIGLACGSLATSIMFFRVAHKLCGGISMIPALPTKQELKTISKYGGLLMVGYGSAALRDQTDKLVLARFASTTWAGYYGLAARLAGLVQEFVKFFYQPLLTAAGSLYASKNWAGIQRLYRNMIAIVGIAAGVLAIVVASLNERIQIIWLGHTRPSVSIIILILLAGNTSSVILTGPGTSICRAIGKVWVETCYVVVNLSANLILSIVLVMTVGPMGTVIATGSTVAVASILFSVILPRVVDMPKDATSHSRILFVATGVFAVAAFFVNSLIPKAHGRADALVEFLVLAPLFSAPYIAFAIWIGVVKMSSIRKVAQRLRSRFA